MVDNSKDLTNNNQYAHETYNIEYWSDGLFNIDNDGNVVVKNFYNIHKDYESSIGCNIKLDNIIKKAQLNNINLPLLIRFPDIIKYKLNNLITSFNKAFIKYNYNNIDIDLEQIKNKYLPAYPIKVNQQKSVILSLIEESIKQDSKLALEAGSKPELFITSSLAHQYNKKYKNNNFEIILICNGYKDKDYLKLAIYSAIYLNINTNIIIEKLSELDLILEILAVLQRENSNKKINNTNLSNLRLGVRVRLSSLGKGNWQNTGGIKSKFGLNSMQLLVFLRKLKENNLLDILKVLHFHMGSQISDLSDIKAGLKEGARLYAEINRYGAKLDSIDVGGGLGVDYEGSKSRSYFSINYDIDKYVELIVKTISNICQQENLVCPVIITESGRAMVAHHAVLISNIIDIEEVIPEAEFNNYSNNHNIDNNTEQKYNLISDLKILLDDLISKPRDAIEIYYQAKNLYNQAQNLYINGDIHLVYRSETENLFYKICYKLIKILQPNIARHRELLDILNEDMANKIFCNLSIFQSMPDIWGLDQVFPILPLTNLHELNKDNYMRGIIQDMTCDSDGRINNYIDGQGIESSLPMPNISNLSNFTSNFISNNATNKNNYNIGFFLVGAYQEILGDLHNLFGDTASVDVVFNKNDFEITNIKKGDVISKVINHVDFTSDELLKNIDNQDMLKFLEKFVSGTAYYNK